MKKVQRARTESAKDQRRLAILKAAKKIVDKQGFANVSLESVARECGVVKATLYLYFKNREEILLAILRDDFLAWMRSFQELLVASERPFSEKFAENWVIGISANPRLAVGMTYLHLLLEPNVSVEFAIRWKEFLRDQLKELHYAILTRFQPQIPFQLIGGFMLNITGITVGFWLQSQSNDVVKKVYATNPELKILQTDFAWHAKVTIKSLLDSAEFSPLKSLERIPVQG